MALRKIVEQGDSVLNKVCRPVTEFNKRLHDLLDDMLDTLEEANGAGLAAPQVGILRRIFIADIHGDGTEYKEFINPEIISVSGSSSCPSSSSLASGSLTA